MGPLLVMLCLLGLSNLSHAIEAVEVGPEEKEITPFQGHLTRFDLNDYRLNLWAPGLAWSPKYFSGFSGLRGNLCLEKQLSMIAIDVELLAVLSIDANIDLEFGGGFEIWAARIHSMVSAYGVINREFMANINWTQIFIGYSKVFIYETPIQNLRVGMGFSF